MAEGQDVRDRMIRQIDRLLAQHLGEDTECIVDLLVNRNRVTNLSGRFEETVATAEILVRSQTVRRDPVRASTAYRDLAAALGQLGRAVESRGALIQAAAFVPQLPAATAAATLRALADKAMSEGDWLLADRANRRAMRILRDSLHTDPAGMRLRMGRLLTSHAYLLQRRAAREADPAQRRMLARHLVAATDTAAAILAAAQTDNPTEAAFDAGKHSLALIDGAYGLAVLGRHDDAAAQVSSAMSLASPQAQDVFSYLLSDVWLRKAETEQMAGRLGTAARSAAAAREACRLESDLSCEAATVERWAAIAEDDGRLGDAEAGYRDATALRDIEWERARLQDWSAGAFSETQAPYRGLARVLFRTGRHADAFGVLDGARARSLRDMRAHLALRDHLTAGRRARVDSLLGAVHAERLTLLESTAGPDDEAATVLRISRLQARVAAETREPHAGLVAPTLAHLQRTLRAQNRTLVSYLVGERETIAFVVTADTLVARALPTTSVDIRRLMRAAGGPWTPGAPDAAVQLGPLHDLHERLVRPLRDVLPDRDGLAIIPDGPLADLPFEMLVEEPASDYASARFLVRRQPISTDLAAALVVEDADRPAESLPLSLVAFGRSQFDGAGGRWRGRSGPLLSNLPNVAGEIGRVRARVGNRETALDDEATEARFVASAGQAHIVHIATHAEADPACPLYSRVYLWDDPGAGDDGVLHLFELQDLRLPADLVVLSGCSTAAGQAHTGEGTIGLQYGVRAAGARAAIATLWPVDDRATAEIVDTFYEGLASGLPKDRALQRAQVAYLDAHAGADASPFYWAAAVLSGSPAPIRLDAPAPLWPWGAGLALLAATAGRLAWQARRRPADA